MFSDGFPMGTGRRSRRRYCPDAARTGCTILAEGIENAAHLEQANELGATLGQGWYFAHPGPLDELAPVAVQPGIRQRTLATPASPFSAIDPATARVGTKQLLLGLSLKLEHHSLTMEIPPIVLASLQDARHVPDTTAARYEELADRCPLVGMVGAGLVDPPAAGVRSAALEPGDPLREEWVVAVLGPNFAGALVGRDLGDTGPEDTRRFAFSLSFDHEVVAQAARSVLRRLPSAESVTVAAGRPSDRLVGAAAGVGELPEWVGLGPQVDKTS